MVHIRVIEIPCVCSTGRWRVVLEENGEVSLRKHFLLMQKQQIRKLN